MSKKAKLVFLILIVAIAGGATYWKLSQKNTDSFVQKEISIKQAGVAGDELVEWQDFAGFSFKYPNSMKITEVELEDDAVYSSLEIEAADGNKLRLRVYDDQAKDLEEWLNNFEQKNVVKKERAVLWTEMEGKQINYGVPEMLKTVAVNNGIVYSLEGPTEDRLDEIHQQIITSFEFNQKTKAEMEPVELNTAIETEGVELIEETTQ